MMPRKVDGRCIYNPNILCVSAVCKRCGWNPDVEAERKARIREKLKREAKYYARSRA